MEPAAEPTDEEVKNLAADAIDADPCDFFEINPGQLRFVQAVYNPKPDSLTIVFFLKGNGLGGTFELIRCWSAIMFPTANPWFKKPPFNGQWPFKKSARLVSTVDALGDKNALQTSMRTLFPYGRWTQHRGGGKPYYSDGETDTGWDFDVKTYDQDPLQAASATKGLIIFSEPPPYPMFIECCTRIRGRGLVLVDMTQLDMADWAEDLINDEALILDGKKVGDVRVVYADVHENCRDHFPPDPNDPTKPCGQRTHTSIEADIALWPAEEREARKTGKSMNRSGRIYPEWGARNEIIDLPTYYQECWDKDQILISHSMDPHDRKPWAMIWFATYPNEDVIAFAEWPSFDFQAARSSPLNDSEDYRDLILDVEYGIGKLIRKGGRIGDPRFLEAPKAGTNESVRTMLAKACRHCVYKFGIKDKEQLSKCPHKLFYRPAPDSARINHSVVRAYIGDDKVRPKLYAMKESCPNFCYGARHYSYWEEKNKQKALSERPQYKVKDFMDVCRYFFNAKLNLWPAEAEAVPEADIRKAPGPR